MHHVSDGPFLLQAPFRQKLRAYQLHQPGATQQKLCHKALAGTAWRIRTIQKYVWRHQSPITPINAFWNFTFQVVSHTRPKPYSMLNLFCRDFLWFLFAARVVMRVGGINKKIQSAYTWSGVIQIHSVPFKSEEWELRSLHSDRKTISHRAGTACRYSCVSSISSES